jgi:hypothetical protein
VLAAPCPPGFSSAHPLLPTEVPPLPDALYVREQSWNYWQGSPGEITPIARRADAWMSGSFCDWASLPRDAWHRPGGQLRQQESVDANHTVVSALPLYPEPGEEIAANGVTADLMAEEIEARRSGVRQVIVCSSATWRIWSAKGIDVFQRVPLKPAGQQPREAPGSVSVTAETVTVPHRIIVHFQTESPAARLEVIAPTPQLCRTLYNVMRPHVAAGARPKVWRRRRPGQLGVAVGAAIGIIVGFTVQAVVGIGSGLLGAYVLGTAANWIRGWAFPYLELLESWGRSRWSIARTYL